MLEGVKTIAFEIDGPLAILVHGEKGPTDREWSAWIAALEPLNRPGIEPRCLVVTDGDVVPTPKQRAALNRAIAERKGQPVPTAVMTCSRVARSIVTILSWFNSAIRAFDMNELTEALEYLHVAPAKRSSVLARVMRMRIEVSLQTSESNAAGELARVATAMDRLMTMRLSALREQLQKR